MKTVANTFKSLSDETRLRIVAILLAGELCVCDLMAILELPQSTVSRHLATLRHAGLVEDRRQGMWMYYRLAAGTHDDLLDYLRKYLMGLPQVERDYRTLTSYLEKKGAAACG